jgi:hypothetical protein
VCTGRYVWECLDSVDQNWCNIYAADSPYVFLAWRLLDTVPDPITNTSTPIVSNSTSSITELTDDELIEYMANIPLLDGLTSRTELQRVLPISVTEAWTHLMADQSDFYSPAAYEDVIVSYDPSWYEPTETTYKLFLGQPVLKQRNISFTITLPPNPFAKTGDMVQHSLLLN